MEATPGPWTFEYGAAYHAEKGRLILADRDNDKTSPTERDANVRLCAAAPSLLDTLTWTLEQLNTLTTDAFSTGGDRMIRDRLGAAIDKARGQG